MADNIKPFKENEFAAKRNDCVAHTITDTYRSKNKWLIGQQWEKTTVYKLKHDGTWLEWVNSSTGSWFKVTNEDKIAELNREYTL